MSQGYPVLITRLKRSYLLIFDKKMEIIEVIKQQDNTKFHDQDNVKGWVMPALSLYRVMAHFKASGFVEWHWEDQELMDKFIEKCPAIRKTETERLERLGNLEAWNTKMVNYKEKLKAMKEFKFDFTPYIRGISPFPHQKAAALWLWQAKTGILAAQMGLGKTLIYTLAMEIDPTVKKVLVICPNSLKLTLRDEEIHKYFNAKAFILNAKRKNPYPAADCKYFITNYEYFARADFDAVKKLKAFGIDKPDVVVIDESHRIKERSSNTFQNIYKHLGKAKGTRFIMSTGTPIKSASRELYTQLHLINPDVFHNQDKFYEEYCGMQWDKNIKMWVYIPTLEKAEELNRLIQPYMFRILKEEALDLPEKIFTRIILELTPEEQKIYDQIEEGVANEIFNEDKMGAGLAITILLRLQQYCAMVKVKHLEEMISRMFDEGEKVVFIDRFKETLELMNRSFPTQTAIHYGQTSEEDRQQVKLQFIDPNSDLMGFLGSAATCNAGLTLTVSNHMFLNTPEWTVADCDQLFDRIHRIGQKKTCYYYLPLIKGTVDEHVYNSLEAKRRVFAKVIDNQDYKDTSNASALNDVLQELRKKYKKR